VDDIVTVSESEILAAIRALALDAKLVAEPSGAVAFAAFLFRADNLPPARKTVAVISGGNIDPALLARVLSAVEAEPALSEVEGGFSPAKESSK
jgi:threonine dehydratase